MSNEFLEALILMDLPKEFFTPQTMLTLTGATGATFVIANGLQRAFDFNPKWLALVIAVSICQFGVFTTGGGAIDYFVGVVNGFLVYCTAAGATGLAGSRDLQAQANAGGFGTRSASALYPRRFLSRWW